ncbi:MAG TPA: class I SAM-dependent methyltransferase [Terriglobia bacterium]
MTNPVLEGRGASNPQGARSTGPREEVHAFASLDDPTPRSCVLAVEEGYELWAPTYDSDPNPLLALEERMVGALLPGLTGKDVLDFACGTGRWLERLVRSGVRRAVAFDLSPAMLAVANAKPGIRQHLVRAHCTALPFRSGMADLVICSFALSHVPDLRLLARELASVTRPGADCYISDVHPAAHARGWRTGFRHAGRSVEIASFTRPVDQVREAFASRGFELKRLLESSLGEPERPIFVQAGRGHLFDDAARVWAVVVCHFRRAGSSIEAR